MRLGGIDAVVDASSLQSLGELADEGTIVSVIGRPHTLDVKPSARLNSIGGKRSGNEMYQIMPKWAPALRKHDNIELIWVFAFWRTSG